MKWPTAILPFIVIAGFIPAMTEIGEAPLDQVK
jgi:hypothetical protein